MASVDAQRVAPARVVVVDDGSEAAVHELLVRWAEKRKGQELDTVLITGTWGNAPAARNAAVPYVETEWVMFFDSDDVMDADHVATAVECLRANADADIIGWDVEYVTAGGKICVKPFEVGSIKYHNIMHGTLATQRYMARLSLVRRAGLWNPRVPIWNDIELGARMLGLKPKVVKREGPVTVRVHCGEDSITGSSWGSRYAQYLVALEALRRAMPDHTGWVDVKAAILAGDLCAEGDGRGRELYSRLHKTLAVRLCFGLKRRGVRGVARMFKFLAG